EPLAKKEHAHEVLASRCYEESTNGFCFGDIGSRAVPAVTYPRLEDRVRGGIVSWVCPTAQTLAHTACEQRSERCHPERTDVQWRSPLGRVPLDEDTRGRVQVEAGSRAIDESGLTRLNGRQQASAEHEIEGKRGS
ncbi:MAG: hypothetical protein GWN29_03715, partial [Gammaproteobacteria bacterium]|nr:hypothetical protein [Gammaproteobacteria bacterium]